MVNDSRGSLSLLPLVVLLQKSLISDQDRSLCLIFFYSHFQNWVCVICMDHFHLLVICILVAVFSASLDFSWSFNSEATLFSYINYIIQSDAQILCFFFLMARVMLSHLSHVASHTSAPNLSPCDFYFC